LLLTTGKLTRMMVFPSLQTDRGEHTISAFAQLLIGELMFSVEQRQLNVFTCRSPRQKVKILENKPDFPITNIGELIPIQMGDITPIK
jgi:hypothetical protein